MRQRKDPMRRPKNRAVKWIVKTIIAILFIIVVINVLNWMIEDDGAWKPDYPKTDIGSIVSKQELTEEDYQTIYKQTGLGRPAADVLLQKNTGNDRVTEFEKHQNNFFSSGEYECRNVAVIVYEEKIRDKDGNLVNGFEIPDLRDGDIFITKSTHSLGWRHGHAAIVTNAAKGETVEAILLGHPAMLQNVTKWRSYGSFIQLRLKDSKNVKNVDPDEVAEFAKKELKGVPYGLLSGFPVKAPEKVKKTQCSHLVWYAYQQFGLDLDSDGSWLVTPKDIANSDLLEVVQVYGFDPETLWQ